MTGRRIWRWIGVAAQLYVIFAVILVATNIGAIVIINGTWPLTREALAYILARDAFSAIIPTIIGCVMTAVFVRSLRRKRS
jgi:hypothetical protein